MMAALISGGINALQGKRGSDLLKSTVRDTAIAYALGPGMGTGQGTTSATANLVGKEAAKQTAGQVSQQAAQEAAKELAAEQVGQQAGRMTAKQIGESATKTLAERTTQPSFLERTFSAIEKPFLKPGTQDISKFRVGLGAAALGGGAYAAGAFDPKPMPDPKYAGYNRFYAADPSMFQPFSGKEIDYSKYPEGAPYSGLQEGGIADIEMMSPDDEMLAQSQVMTDDGPGIVSMLNKMFAERFTDEDREKAKAMMASLPARTIQPISGATAMKDVTETAARLPNKIKKEFVMKFKKDPDATAIEYAVTMNDKDRITVTDVQSAKEALSKMTEEVELTPEEMSGVMGLAPADGENVRIPEAQDTPEAIQQLMDTFRARSSNEPAQPQFKEGDLVDVLPSKYKRDQNDESNYKRTSGKMVTDETGKGSGNKDTMLAQLADGEFVTKAKSVLGAGKAMGGKTKEEQRKLGAQFFYKQMSELEKLAS